MRRSLTRAGKEESLDDDFYRAAGLISRIKKTAGLVSCMALAGCVANPKAIIRGPETIIPGQESIVRAQDSTLIIISVDGRKPSIQPSFHFHPQDAGLEVTMAAGNHNIVAGYDNFRKVGLLGRVFSLYSFDIFTEPLHSYIIRYGISQKAAQLWIEDSNTLQHIGKIKASENEPILGFEVKWDQCPLFTMTPPREQGWIVEKRNKSGLWLRKVGESSNEQYNISVDLFDLPKLTSGNEFLARVRQGQLETRTKTGTFKYQNVMTDTMELMSGRKDYCVSYHIVSENVRSFKIPMVKSDPEMFEAFGYACRHPENKNFGINFGYLHKYERGKEDPQLQKKATEAFQSVEF